jgi:integrase
LLIACGTDCITISKRLGHSKVSTTTDIYSHLMQKADKTASDVLEKLLIKVNDK